MNATKPFSVTLTIVIAHAIHMPGNMYSETTLTSTEEETAERIRTEPQFGYSATIASLTLAAVSLATDMEKVFGIPKREIIQKMFDEMKRLSENGSVKQGPSAKDN